MRTHHRLAAATRALLAAMDREECAPTVLELDVLEFLCREAGLAALATELHARRVERAGEPPEDAARRPAPTVH